MTSLWTQVVTANQWLMQEPTKSMKLIFFADANGGKQLRNEIATSLWRDYQNILHERSGQMNIDEDDDFDSELGHL